MTKLSALEAAMFAHVWATVHRAGALAGPIVFDLADAASWAPYAIAEDQPTVSKKWNEAAIIMAFNTLHSADLSPYVEHTWPARAPKRVPASGYWDCQFRLTPKGRELAQRIHDAMKNAQNPFIGSSFDDFMREDA